MKCLTHNNLLKKLVLRLDEETNTKVEREDIFVRFLR